VEMVSGEMKKSIAIFGVIQLTLALTVPASASTEYSVSQKTM
jgi:hypothetical protein